MNKIKRNSCIRALAVMLAVLMLGAIFASCTGGAEAVADTVLECGEEKLPLYFYEFMLSRMKGALARYKYEVSSPDFWDTKTEDGLTYEEYYNASILENCKNYLAAVVLFDRQGLKLSDATLAEIDEEISFYINYDGGKDVEKFNRLVAKFGVDADTLRECYIIEAKYEYVIADIYGGGSLIDGRNCFDEVGEEHYRGPHAFNMWFCENVTLEGYTIKDSANWAHAIQNSRGIKVKGITVLAGHDGFDVRTCDDVLVEDSSFLTGDDCIAGFDNIGVTVRNCYFESSCSLFRFGGTDVLIENCRGKDPATYGFRGHLTPEQKKNRADTDENCRHTCHNVFLYYCDNRAKIRRTPGNFVFRSCEFDGIKRIIDQPFGHIWCCNRALDNVTFEDCVFKGIYDPSTPVCPDGEPMTVTIKNSKIIAKPGYEDKKLFVARGMRKIELENVSIEGFTDPTIVCNPECEVVTNNSGNVMVENK